MSTLDKYGFNDPNIDSFKKVRLFIDKILSPMGLDDNIRLNPALEKDLILLLASIDMSQIDLDARPLMIAARKYDVKGGRLEIEQPETEGPISNSKRFQRTTYEAQIGKGGMLKTIDTVDGYLLGEKNQVYENYDQEFSFFTNNGVEMSSIKLSRGKGILDDISYSAYIPELTDRYVAISYGFDSQNNLEISELPEDYSDYVKKSRDPNFVEQIRYYRIEKNKDSIKEYVGKKNIHSEHGIDRLFWTGSDIDLCGEKNITTGEVLGPKHPEYLSVFSSEELLSDIKKSAASTRYSTGLRGISPLQRRLVQELIVMSNGRAPLDKSFTTKDYEVFSEDLRTNNLKEILTVISGLTPAKIEKNSPDKSEGERQ